MRRRYVKKWRRKGIARGNPQCNSPGAGMCLDSFKEQEEGQWAGGLPVRAGGRQGQIVPGLLCIHGNECGFYSNSNRKP